MTGDNRARRSAGAFGWFERLIDPFAPYSDTAPPRGLGAFLRWSLRDARGALWALALLSLAVGRSRRWCSI